MRGARAGSARGDRSSHGLQKPLPLQNCPFEPDGHDVSVIIFSVQICEHSGCPTWSKLSVHTPLSQSVAVLLAVAHCAPNVRAAGPEAASGVDEVLPEHAASHREHTRRNRCMQPWYRAA